MSVVRMPIHSLAGAGEGDLRGEHTRACEVPHAPVCIDVAFAGGGGDAMSEEFPTSLVRQLVTAHKQHAT